MGFTRVASRPMKMCGIMRCILLKITVAVAIEVKNVISILDFTSKSYFWEMSSFQVIYPRQPAVKDVDQEAVVTLVPSPSGLTVSWPRIGFSVKRQHVGPAEKLLDG